MGCFVVAGFLLTSVLRSPSAIAELLVQLLFLFQVICYTVSTGCGFVCTTMDLEQISPPHAASWDQ